MGYEEAVEEDVEVVEEYWGEEEEEKGDHWVGWEDGGWWRGKETGIRAEKLRSAETGGIARNHATERMKNCSCPKEELKEDVLYQSSGRTLQVSCEVPKERA